MSFYPKFVSRLLLKNVKKTNFIENIRFQGVKGKVFYGQEPPIAESTTTECGVNYQLLAVMYWSSPMGNSQLQSTTTSYGQLRQRLQIQLTGRTPHPHGQYPLSATCVVQISATSVGLERAATACEATTLPMQPLRVLQKSHLLLQFHRYNKIDDFISFTNTRSRTSRPQFFEFLKNKIREANQIFFLKKNKIFFTYFLFVLHVFTRKRSKT